MTRFFDISLSTSSKAVTSIIVEGMPKRLQNLKKVTICKIKLYLDNIRLMATSEYSVRPLLVRLRIGLGGKVYVIASVPATRRIRPFRPKRGEKLFFKNWTNEIPSWRTLKRCNSFLSSVLMSKIRSALRYETTLCAKSIFLHMRPLST